MKFCQQCGTQLEDTARFCAACGTAQAEPAQEQSAPQAQPQPAAAPQPDFFDDAINKVKKINDTPDETASHDPQDIANHKVMGILAYIGFLVFIPAFAVKGSRFAKFHANQGLNLFILEVAYAIVEILLTLLLRIVFPLRITMAYVFTRGVIYNILTGVLGLLWLVPVALMVLGIINAATGKAKELPIIGKIKLLK